MFAQSLGGPPEGLYISMLGPWPLVPGSFQVRVAVGKKVSCLGTLVVPERHLPQGRLRSRVSHRVTEQCSRVWTRILSSVPNLAPLNLFPRQHFAPSRGAGPDHLRSKPALPSHGTLDMWNLHSPRSNLQPALHPRRLISLSHVTWASCHLLSIWVWQVGCTAKAGRVGERSGY